MSQFAYGSGVGHKTSLFRSAMSLQDMYYQLASHLSKDRIQGNTLDEIYAHINPKPAVLRGQVNFTEESGKKMEMFNNLFQLKTILKENKEEIIQKVYLYDNKGFFNRQSLSKK